MLAHLRSAVAVLVGITIVCGVLYPLTVWRIGQAAWPDQADGSFVRGPDGAIVGSLLIGQAWTRPEYFHGRPSAIGYDGATSGGSNLGPANPALAAARAEREAQLARENPDAVGPVPPELLAASASGLDPHVTLAAARWQAPRVARARGLSEADVAALIDAHAHGSDLGLFARVDVLELNLALDGR
jgi:K+-transporting ATPase ATPase C chain